jgi:hypothetical protein
VIATCEQGTRLAAAIKGSILPYTGSLLIFLGLALYENGKLEDARQSTQRGETMLWQQPQMLLWSIGHAAYIRFGQHQPEETVKWLHWPIHAAEQAGRTLALMRMLILQALAYQERGQTAEASNNIKRALQYAEPEGHITMFVEMGQSMVPLLLTLLSPAEASTEVSLPFVQTLLRELGVEPETEQPSPN